MGLRWKALDAAENMRPEASVAATIIAMRSTGEQKLRKITNYGIFLGERLNGPRKAFSQPGNPM